jgi:hypothetical protein
MVKGRRQEEWDRTIALVCVVKGLFGGQPDPLEMHPYRQPLPRAPGQEGLANRDGWKLLETGLKQVAEGR